ncbi:ABC transporter permease [Paenibacillus rigui]|uniref:ABC transporter permease n=1 Tax=Paenibacillus rigui TaxID=554312 RepID=A0A229UX88_9BACL|nr:ABC transporter permease [Paenibacillus rigui]OXM87765.1 ABC transporter permease [Paenibacillus rigui]
MEFYTMLLIAAVTAGTPLLFAVLGGILSERSGIIHLGTEGIMLMGAVSACSVYIQTGSLLPALAAALAVSAALGLLHAFLTVTLGVNQVISGLAMTLFGTGLSAYIGKPFAGRPVNGAVPKLDLPWLEVIPLFGRVFSHLDVLIWFSLVLAVALHVYMTRTSWGLQLKAIGENPATADSMGLSVTGARYLYVIAGSMLMGLAGAYLILAYTPSWIENMTAGRGWIAVALVIFARWNPLRALLCAYLFGGLDALGFRIQLLEQSIPSYFLKMIPYVITIAVLMLEGWRNRGKPTGEPAALGIPYDREKRA